MIGSSGKETVANQVLTCRLGPAMLSSCVTGITQNPQCPKVNSNVGCYPILGQVFIRKYYAAFEPDTDGYPVRNGLALANHAIESSMPDYS